MILKTLRSCAMTMAIVAASFGLCQPAMAGTNDDFIRGDCNVDGATNIADAISTLSFLFSAEPILCGDACDSNDDGAIDIADAVSVLGVLFGGGAGVLPAPGAQDCGADPTNDSLDCLEGPSSCASTGLSLATDIQPIFDNMCIGCHGSSGASLDLDISAGATLMNTIGIPSMELASMPLITAGDAQNSYLWHKVNGSQASVGGVGAQMPFAAPPLPQADIEAIELWINQGANP